MDPILHYAVVTLVIRSGGGNAIAHAEFVDGEAESIPVPLPRG